MTLAATKKPSLDHERGSIYNMAIVTMMSDFCMSTPASRETGFWQNGTRARIGVLESFASLPEANCVT